MPHIVLAHCADLYRDVPPLFIADGDRIPGFHVQLLCHLFRERRAFVIQVIFFIRHPVLEHIVFRKALHIFRHIQVHIMPFFPAPDGNLGQQPLCRTVHIPIRPDRGQYFRLIFFPCVSAEDDISVIELDLAVLDVHDGKD